jgi:uncharacterized membrane protein YbaN (DUF454 family)
MEPAPTVAGSADAPPADPPPNDRSRPLRAVLAVVGTVSLAIGVLGILVPVLPTTPFLLLAAACYARASDRLYAWLLGQRSLGPIITRWRESRSMEPAVKTRALVIVVVTFAASILLVDALLLRVVLAVTGTIVAVFLARVPTSA